MTPDTWLCLGACVAFVVLAFAVADDEVHGVTRGAHGVIGRWLDALRRGQDE